MRWDKRIARIVTLSKCVRFILNMFRWEYYNSISHLQIPPIIFIYSQLFKKSNGKFQYSKKSLNLKGRTEDSSLTKHILQYIRHFFLPMFPSMIPFVYNMIDVVSCFFLNHFCKLFIRLDEI